MKFNNILSVSGLDGVIVRITNDFLSCSCEQRMVCGEEVHIGSVISFAPDYIFVEGVEEDVIKVMMQGFHVSLIP